MAGPFCNTERQYFKDPDLENGHWYRGTGTRMLFIVPFGESEIIGPDEPVLDQLNAIYRARGFEDVDPNTVASQLELDVVHAPLRRFDPAVGYYSA